MAAHKERFLSDAARVQKWNDLVASPLFTQALDTAMLEFLGARRDIRQARPVYDAQANHHALTGAMEFAEVLVRLGQRAELRGPTTYSDLIYENHEAHVKVPESLKSKVEPK